MASLLKQWLVEFVRACSQDVKQYIFSQSLNVFLDLFQYFFTLKVDPYFYRRCLARKKQINLPGDADQKLASDPATQAQTSAVMQEVFVGLTREKLELLDASSVLKKPCLKKLGLLPEEDKKPKEINDGFTTEGNMKKKKLKRKSKT